MQLLARRISQLIPDWNRKELTEADVYAVCDRFDVRIVEVPLRREGFYFRLLGRDFIAVDSRLKGVQRVRVLFHELGHFLLHVPESGPTARFHGLAPGSRYEREADLVALCAVLPVDLVRSSPSAPHDVDPDVWANRLEILVTFGI